MNNSLNSIICGDSIDVLKDIEENSIHLTFTSPPYYNAKEYSSWKTYNDYLSFLNSIFSEIFRATKDKRICAVNLSPVIVPRKSRQHESKRCAIPFHFFSLMEKIGWIYLDDIVWLKPEGAAKNRNGGFYQHRKPVAYKPNVVSETIFIFQKPAPFLIDKVVRSYSGEVLKNSLVPDDYERSNVWKINPETRSKHPAPFPKELSDKIIQYYSYVGDTVLDPFIGSGTTAISCINMNRNFLGIEKNKEYVDMAEKRIKKHLTAK